MAFARHFQKVGKPLLECPDRGTVQIGYPIENVRGTDGNNMENTQNGKLHGEHYHGLASDFLRCTS